ncbi:aminotransferase class V-fold PLP-dependent enzyme [Sphingobacterium daejeonense]|uniref:aminotransferase class V-fold PLP-dependent enzyme n=1 Tax=Sphingobacterium daejeonense TaxID=371142 RepID=UPI0010C2D45E|nr:aminotransferase class V-fold PLP-dependent enzyme [Sphingobacterium daejeonense]VTP89812.1 Kynureninase [Sphingobacterium daejeonense]
MTFKEHFNIPNDIIYLNTPGNGLLPKNSLNWRKKWEDDFFETNGELRDKQPEFIDGVKSTVASFFGANKNNTFLTPNFSFGYSTLIDLLPENLSYLVLEDEYPSLQYPIVNRKLQHSVAPFSAEVEKDLLNAIKKQKPDVLIFSIVQYISGLMIDLNFIKEIKSTYPNLLIIADGTQYLGTEPFNFETSGIDALGGSGYKWLLSGFGNGFMMLSDDFKSWLEELRLDIPLPQVAMWKDKSLLDTFFEPGHQDTLSHGTLQQGLLFLENLGLDNIKEHVTTVKNEAYKLLLERDLILPYIAEREVKSSLINVQINPELYPNLINSGIKCFPRGTGIRIGIHLYNDLRDIQNFVNIIESIR